MTAKEEFIKILFELTKCEFTEEQVDEIVAKLNKTDFFNAPATATNHDSFPGGLCEHSLNVYYNLCSLIKNKHLEDKIPRRSIIICGLLHDLVKCDYYEVSIRNKKLYSEKGSKYDELGRFDWISEKSYAVKSPEDRFLYGSLEETSEMLVRKMLPVPLTLTESIAILHVNGGDRYGIYSSLAIYDKYPLACLLHVADEISSFIDGRKLTDE